MTCVVAVVDGETGTVHMAADSSAVEENLVIAHVPPKVFVSGEFGIGYCHSFRLGQIVQHHFVPPLLKKKATEDEVIAYMIKEFVPELRMMLEVNNYPSNDDEKSSWSIIVGVRSSIFIIESDFHVGYYENYYAAIGAGSEYALGAMFSSQKHGREKAHEGLAAASNFCPFVIGPFNFIEV